jgi:hypothetical protein
MRAIAALIPRGRSEVDLSRWAPGVTLLGTLGGASLAVFTTVVAGSAPRRIQRSRKLNERMKEYEGYLSRVRPGCVGRLVPDSGESTQGVRRRVARAARRLERPIRVWDADGAVYFSLS